MGKPSFFLLALALAAVCLFIPVWRDNGEITNCLSIFFLWTREEFLAEDGFQGLSLMGRVLGGYFLMFLPVVVSLAVLPILCEERESGQLRFVLPRSGKRVHAVGSLLASVFCGGLVAVLGYFIFFLFLLAHSWVAGGLGKIPGELGEMSSRVLGVWLYGMACAVWTYLVSIFVENRYILASVPYVLLWFLERFTSSFSYERLEENVPLGLFVRAFGASHLFEGSLRVLYPVAVYALLAVLAVLLRLTAMGRRDDCGR